MDEFILITTSITLRLVDCLGSFGGRNGQSLRYVAVHEIGHALGLQHSNVQGAVMWPTVKTGTPTLHQDDINGITSLYGECMYQ